MKLRLDLSSCTGHGRCYVLAPDLFDADDNGYAILKCAEPPDSLRQLAESTVLNCPERAIVIDED
jgi:ferredoxin